MPYGFQVLNSSGEVVVDHLSPCLQLSQRVTVSVTSTSAHSSGKTRQVFSVGAPSDFVFFKPAVGESFTRYGGSADYVALTNSSTPPEAWICKPASEAAPSGAGYGLEVYDASGGLTFSAGKDLVSFKEFKTFAYGAAAQTVSGNAVYIPPNVISIMQGPESFGLMLATGVKRTDTAAYEYSWIDYTQGPNIFSGPWDQLAAFVQIS